MKSLDHMPNDGEITDTGSLSEKLKDIRAQLGVVPVEESLKNLFALFSHYSVDAADVPLIQSRIAFLCELLMETWQKDGGTIAEFKNKVNTLLQSKDITPAFFKETRATQLGKRQPDMIEAIKETLNRFELLEKLEPIFKKPCKGIIVGGSLSYGPFFNIRGQCNTGESSDIDAILVWDKKDSDADWNAFMESTYFSESDKNTFMKRKDVFLSELRSRGVADILSQKFHIQNTEYDLSAHFFTLETLNTMLISDIDEETAGNDRVVVLKDYKSKPFPHAVCAQTNFEGVPDPFVVPAQTGVEQGVITKMPSCSVRNHKFHPGVYDNLVLPAFFVLV